MYMGAPKYFKWLGPIGVLIDTGFKVSKLSCLSLTTTLERQFISNLYSNCIEIIQNRLPSFCYHDTGLWIVVQLIQNNLPPAYCLINTK